MKAAKNRHAPRIPGKIQRIRLHPKDILWVSLPNITDDDYAAIRRALLDCFPAGQKMLITNAATSIRRLRRHA